MVCFSNAALFSRFSLILNGSLFGLPSHSSYIVIFVTAIIIKVIITFIFHFHSYHHHCHHHLSVLLLGAFQMAPFPLYSVVNYFWPRALARVLSREWGAVWDGDIVIFIFAIVLAGHLFQIVSDMWETASQSHSWGAELMFYCRLSPRSNRNTIIVTIINSPCDHTRTSTRTYKFTQSQQTICLYWL